MPNGTEILLEDWGEHNTEQLSEMPTGMGSKWVLVKYENDFYAYGYEQDMYSFYGFPVDQCGSKENLLKHFQCKAELCRKNIKKYQKELKKEKEMKDGWKILIEHEQKELEMLTEFARVLSA